MSHDFLQSLLSLDPLHHGASVLTSTILNKKETWWVRSFGTKTEQPNKDCRKTLGLSLCTVTNAHQLFCLMRIYPLFFCFLFISVKTKHAAYRVYAVRVTLEGEETDKQEMPALLTAPTQADMTDNVHPHDIIVHQSFPALLLFPPQPPL